MKKPYEKQAVYNTFTTKTLEKPMKPLFILKEALRIPNFLNSDGMPHGSNQSDLSSYAAELTEKEEELYSEGVNQVKTYKDISWRIQQLKSRDERDVLFYRYIKGMDWWKIAETMDFSESWVYELHGRALKKIQI